MIAVMSKFIRIQTYDAEGSYNYCFNIDTILYIKDRGSEGTFIQVKDSSPYGWHWTKMPYEELCKLLEEK